MKTNPFPLETADSHKNQHITCQYTHKTHTHTHIQHRIPSSSHLLTQCALCCIVVTGPLLSFPFPFLFSPPTICFLSFLSNHSIPHSDSLTDLFTHSARTNNIAETLDTDTSVLNTLYEHNFVRWQWSVFPFGLGSVWLVLGTVPPLSHLFRKTWGFSSHGRALPSQGRGKGIDTLNLHNLLSPFAPPKQRQAFCRTAVFYVHACDMFESRLLVENHKNVKKCNFGHRFEQETDIKSCLQARCFIARIHQCLLDHLVPDYRMVLAPSASRATLGDQHSVRQMRGRTMSHEHSSCFRCDCCCCCCCCELLLLHSVPRVANFVVVAAGVIVVARVIYVVDVWILCVRMRVPLPQWPMPIVDGWYWRSLPVRAHSFGHGQSQHRHSITPMRKKRNHHWHPAQRNYHREQASVFQQRRYHLPPRPYGIRPHHHQQRSLHRP